MYEDHCIWSATHFIQVPHPKKLRKTSNVAPIARHSLSLISLYYIMFMIRNYIAFIFKFNIWSLLRPQTFGNNLSFLLHTHTHTHTRMRVKQTPHFPTPIYAHTYILSLVLLNSCPSSTLSLHGEHHFPLNHFLLYSLFHMPLKYLCWSSCPNFIARVVTKQHHMTTPIFQSVDITKDIVSWM